MTNTIQSNRLLNRLQFAGAPLPSSQKTFDVRTRTGSNPQKIRYYSKNNSEWYLGLGLLTMAGYYRSKMFHGLSFGNWPAALPEKHFFKQLGKLFIAGTSFIGLSSMGILLSRAGKNSAKPIPTIQSHSISNLHPPRQSSHKPPPPVHWTDAQFASAASLDKIRYLASQKIHPETVMLNLQARRVDFYYDDPKGYDLGMTNIISFEESDLPDFSWDGMQKAGLLTLKQLKKPKAKVMDEVPFQSTHYGHVIHELINIQLGERLDLG